MLVTKLARIWQENNHLLLAALTSLTASGIWITQLGGSTWGQQIAACTSSYLTIVSCGLLWARIYCIKLEQKAPIETALAETLGYAIRQGLPETFLVVNRQRLSTLQRDQIAEALYKATQAIERRATKASSNLHGHETTIKTRWFEPQITPLGYSIVAQKEAEQAAAQKLAARILQTAIQTQIAERRHAVPSISLRA